LISRLNITYAQVGEHVPVLGHAVEDFPVIRICRQLRQLAAFLAGFAVFCSMR
jgi:hypothetical protein